MTKAATKMPALKRGQIRWSKTYTSMAEKCTVCGDVKSAFDPCNGCREIGKAISPALESFCKGLREIDRERIDAENRELQMWLAVEGLASFVEWMKAS